MAATYSGQQIQRYYERIGLPEPWRQFAISRADGKAALEYLTLLQRQHLVTVPFENLSLHYSPARQISLHHDELYRKIVESEGRGGYCMELNAVFGTLMRSIGYSVYPAGARVHNGSGYLGWNHMVNIVTIGDSRYLVDVGFGSYSCPIQPLQLIHDDAGVESIAPARSRLVSKAIEGSLNPSQELWVYQYRAGPEAEFNDTYCLTDVEFRDADFETMNYYTSTNPKSVFTQRVMCLKMLLGEDEKRNEIVGALILTDKLKKRIGSESHTVMEFKGECDRTKALEEYFSITFRPAELESIKGTVTEIRPLQADAPT